MTSPSTAPLGAAGAAAPSGVGPTSWRTSVVREVSHPHPDAVVLRLEVPDRVDHLPGQHYVVGLTAADGYTATRSYSVASDPGDDLVELYVERLPDGEVSGYLASGVVPGDQLDVRGPIGGWFTWDASTTALGVGGGTGVVPLVAMLRHARATARTELLRLAVAARTRAELPYADELEEAGAFVALSREAGSAGRAPARLSAGELEPLVAGAETSYVCGSAVFAEAATGLLLTVGVLPGDIRVERFGPS